VIDIAPTLVKNIEQNSLTIPALLGDFRHQGEYDLIIEQTFSALYHR
jgi:hypothetical protein